MTNEILLASGDCALCGNALPCRPVCDEGVFFCCSGCHAVYNILTAQGESGNFRESPVFRQALKYGIISNPALLEEMRLKERLASGEKERQLLHFEVQEMWCPSCAELIRLTLLKQKGIFSVIVDYATDLAAAEYCPRDISKERIYQLIHALGYRACRPLEEGQEKKNRPLYLRFGIASFCALNLMMFSYPIYSSYFEAEDIGYAKLFAKVSFFAALPVVTYCAFPVWRRFWNGIKVGILGMEALVFIGVSSAFSLSLYELARGSAHVYFDSMSVIIALVLLGKMIEARAKFSAKDSLFRLARSAPRRGRKLQDDGSLKFVPIKEIKKGDLLAAYSGEKIVLDGIVESGAGAVDESLMTGEAMPVRKEKGDRVIAGTILQNGSLTYRSAAVADETALHRIMESITKDIGHKAKYVRSADKIARFFVPAVLAIALLVFLAGGASSEAALRAISVLLISCPCAIGIAAPLAESRLMQTMAGIGALVRNRASLSLLGKEALFAFDKTGTITEGKYQVVSGPDALDEEERRLLKGVAEHSLHPICLAICSAIPEPSLEIGAIEEHPGRGILGRRGKSLILLGSKKFMEGFGIKAADENGREGFSHVYFAVDGELKTTLFLGDRIREGVEEAVRSLNSILLSGDCEAAVSSVAKKCGFNKWRSNCHPLEKRDAVEKMKKEGNIVCFVGDGINDAAALTEADIGISVVSAADISIQVSDILLTTPRLETLLKLQEFGRRGRKIVRQNLFWAFFYNVLGIFLAALGWMSPLFAAAAMVLSSLIVLVNTKRIYRR